MCNISQRQRRRMGYSDMCIEASKSSIMESRWTIVIGEVTPPPPSHQEIQYSIPMEKCPFAGGEQRVEMGVFKMHQLSESLSQRDSKFATS
jgi:hypothetical protein